MPPAAKTPHGLDTALENWKITLLTYRLAVSASALALVVPATAVAQSSPDPAGGQAVTEVIGMGAYRIAKAADPVVVTGFGSYATAKNAGSPVTVTGLGGYSTAGRPGSQVAVTGFGSYRNPAHASAVSYGGGTDGWQMAALSEAALFAALALGSVLILRARRTASGMST